ncbi:MAG: protoporphyrinogen oxidase [Candidatus Neptunochlamydia sp.]|nr:protoporphyrinogen oxidase [Candidatus Neptunochlamydia sp.]
MKKIVIAGGGISGLAVRYYLSKKHPNAEIVLFEKSDRLGGCIESCSFPFFFERGPRTFKASRAEALLNLIDEVDLSDEILYSSKQSSRRFLWKGGKLQALSPFSPLVFPLIPALLKEWRQPYPSDEDETIATFVSRRLGNYAADTFFDPLTLGIFAGDIHKLSISACFPELKAMERDYSSITRAFFKKKRKKKRKGLFTLRGGLQTLIDRLVEKGRGEIHLNTPLTTLDEEERVILALSSQGMKGLFAKDEIAQEFLGSLEEVSLSVVNVAYSKDILKKKGFGYLIPSSEKENILGVVFDSAIFPLQNQTNDETRLTVMLRDGGIETALEGLQRHLGIESAPSNAHLKVWKNIIPQYGVGHLKCVQTFESHLKMSYPRVTCIGNYINGVSLNHCVSLATQVI